MSSTQNILMWAIPAVVSFTWAKITHIGPVFLVISERHGWGVHTGDLIGLTSFTIPILLFLYKRNR